MKITSQSDEPAPTCDETSGTELLGAILRDRSKATADHAGVVVGDIVGMDADGVRPLVVYPGQPGSSAIAARSVVDVFGRHIGREAVLMFENADLLKPIVMGILQPERRESEVASYEVDGTGERLVITAREQLVFRCGAASITLTKAGKIIIDGAYVSSQSSGTNRIRGGSVQLN